MHVVLSFSTADPFRSMDCILFTFEKRVRSCARGVHGLGFSFTLMKSYNKTKAPVFPLQTMLSWEFLFSQIN